MYNVVGFSCTTNVFVKHQYHWHSGEMVSLVNMHAKYEVSFMIYKLLSKNKFCYSQTITDRSKTRCPRIPFKGHKNDYTFQGL